jgi:hypothetical protein
VGSCAIFYCIWFDFLMYSAAFTFCLLQHNTKSIDATQTTPAERCKRCG